MKCNHAAGFTTLQCRCGLLYMRCRTCQSHIRECLSCAIESIPPKGSRRRYNTPEDNANNHRRRSLNYYHRTKVLKRKDVPNA